ncbi:MAG: cytidylate kinase [Thermoprotei archaeon]|nr:MAG: cytidylate kinase [Thermoprotei archaeon]RLF18737.1 MAG: cytidylate kinase [Thermoprotei archaeon]
MNRGLVIAISGPPASGKTTHAKFIAKRFKLRYVSAGQLFRRLASELGLSLEEFHKLAETDPKYDRLVDERSIEEAKKGNVVLEGHLTAWIVRKYADIAIYVKASLEARAMRLAKRDGKSLEEAMNEIRVREESNRQRYLKYYGIDIRDLTIFDLVIDTTYLEVNAVRHIIETYIKEYLKGKRAKLDVQST